MIPPSPPPAPPVVFWWNGPSQHMAPCLDAFGALWPGAVRAVWCAVLSPERERLGWRVPAMERLPQDYLPEADRDAARRTREIVASVPGAIHVYGGMRSVRRVGDAYAAARRDPRARHVVVAEPFRGWGIARRATRHARAFLQSLPYRRRLAALLAMGTAGTTFYRRIGFSSGRVYPFIYQAPAGEALAPVGAGGPLRLVYAGSFHPRKGLRDLLRALARLRHAPWRLTIVGGGAEERTLREEARRSGLDDRLTWRGVLPHDDLLDELARHDAAVVPSRFDGWGAVTNEALQAGLAVLVTDRCSSRDLVEHSGAGAVVAAGRPDALARVLEGWAREPAAVDALKCRARAYRHRIGGEAVARYLRDVLEHATAAGGPRPVPPWVGP